MPPYLNNVFIPLVSNGWEPVDVHVQKKFAEFNVKVNSYSKGRVFGAVRYVDMNEKLPYDQWLWRQTDAILFNPPFKLQSLTPYLPHLETPTCLWSIHAECHLLDVDAAKFIKRILPFVKVNMIFE